MILQAIHILIDIKVNMKMQKHLMALQAAIATWQPSIANQI